MTLSNNLLYLLLLYAVLDKENRISPSAGLLAALAIMVFGACRSAINACCNNNCRCNNNNNCGCNNGGLNNFATAANNPFQTINNLF